MTIIREIEWLSGHAALFNGTLQFAPAVILCVSNKCETVFNPRRECLRLSIGESHISCTRELCIILFQLFHTYR